jgi:hypothetical protein
LAEKEYLIRLGERARKRHYHKTDKGQVVSFMVQLEVEIEKGVWKPVIRYDCAHDFAHRDRYNLTGDHDKEEIPLSYADSLELADRDINTNWDIYQDRFLRGEFP